MKTIQWKQGSRYSDRKNQIQRLINEKQPFALAKYEMRCPMIPDTSAWLYEIILWQTREEKEETCCLTLPMEDFDQLKEEFAMKRLCKKKYGELWGVNDDLLRLNNEFKEAMKPYDHEIDLRHKTYYIPEQSKNDKAQALANLKLAHKAREAAAQRFCQDFDIINWKLTFTKQES